MLDAESGIRYSTYMDQKLIAALNANPQLYEEFRKGWGRETVDEYLTEYQHLPDIAQRLAEDLGINLNNA